MRLRLVPNPKLIKPLEKVTRAHEVEDDALGSTGCLRITAAPTFRSLKFADILLKDFVLIKEAVYCGTTVGFQEERGKSVHDADRL
jgi:hypothetical protein